MSVYSATKVESEESLLFWVMVWFCAIASEQKVIATIKAIKIRFILLLFF